MTKQNRDSLKNQFRDGAQPSAQAFADLIDSALNVVDDGFDKTDKDGFKVAQLGKDGKLISFYQNISVREPSWSLSLGQGGNQLLIAATSGAPALALAVGDPGAAARIGINKTDPDHALDVDGVVAARGRIGATKGRVKADGEWQNLTGELDGCRAFEVVAGVGDKESGRYALVHALALNAFNRNGHITRHESHYGSRCDRIDLRWTDAATPRKFRLQARTRCAYGDHVRIQYFLTELWFDPLMQHCDARNFPDQP